MAQIHFLHTTHTTWSRSRTYNVHLAVHVKKLLHTRKWDDGVWERSGKKMAKECNHRISSCSFVMWRFNTMSGGESVGSTRRVEVERQFVEITFFPRPLYPETLYAAAVAAANVRYYWGSYRNHHFRSRDGKKIIVRVDIMMVWCSMLTCDTFWIAPSWQSKRKNDTAAAQNDQMTAIKVAVRSSNSSNIEWMLWVTLVLPSHSILLVVLLWYVRKVGEAKAYTRRLLVIWNSIYNILPLVS